jgi:cytochrome c oxidase assembly protein subunit 15
MLNKINIKYLLIFSMSLMLIQIFIGTGVREFIDEQSKIYGRLDKDLWLSNPSFNFYFHRSFSILIFLVNGFLFYISRKFNMSMKYINAVMILILLEIIIGAIMYYFAFPIMTQPIHLMVAILIFVIQFYWYLKIN